MEPWKSVLEKEMTISITIASTPFGESVVQARVTKRCACLGGIGRVQVTGHDNRPLFLKDKIPYLSSLCDAGLHVVIEALNGFGQIPRVLSGSSESIEPLSWGLEMDVVHGDY